MADITHDDAALRRLLSRPRNIAVVGASDDPERPAFGVFAYLRDAGHDVLPVNPKYPEVQGVATVPDLAAAARHWPEGIDIVDVFRAPQHLPAVVDEVLGSGARVLWLQLGVVHDGAIDVALEGDLDVVVDRCIKIEQQRLARRPAHTKP